MMKGNITARNGSIPADPYAEIAAAKEAVRRAADYRGRSRIYLRIVAKSLRRLANAEAYLLASLRDAVAWRVQ